MSTFKWLQLTKNIMTHTACLMCPLFQAMNEYVNACLLIPMVNILSILNLKLKYIVHFLHVLVSLEICMPISDDTILNLVDTCFSRRLFTEK